MDILKDLSDSQVRTLANSETPKPMAGTWVLTAPDGQSWTGDSPIQCVQAELHDRVPPQVALARIMRAVMDESEARRREAFDTLPDDYECPH